VKLCKFTPVKKKLLTTQRHYSYLFEQEKCLFILIKCHSPSIRRVFAWWLGQICSCKKIPLMDILKSDLSLSISLKLVVCSFPCQLNQLNVPYTYSTHICLWWLWCIPLYTVKTILFLNISFFFHDWKKMK